MNQYFLLIACLQLWSLITPVNPASTWGPLIFIFAVSATKEAWDDYNRYLSDKKANEREVWIVRHGVKKLVKKSFSSSPSPLSPKKSPLFFFCGRKLFLSFNCWRMATDLLKGFYHVDWFVSCCMFATDLNFSDYRSLVVNYSFSHLLFSLSVDHSAPYADNGFYLVYTI